MLSSNLFTRRAARCATLTMTSVRRSQTTFSNQSKLPRLPIPDLEATLTRYKRSLVPLLDQEAYAKASASIDRFARSGLGNKLQARLTALDSEEAKLGLSWLDRLWLDKGYLEYRIPTLINVNWWNQFVDPPEGLQSAKDGHASPFQLQRASRLVAGMVEYSNRVNAESIPPEASRSGPFCMRQLQHIFGATRVADVPRDTIITTWPATAKHINVIYKDQIFSVPVLANADAPVSVKAIESQLHQIVKYVDGMAESERQPPVGLLTSEHRDTWGHLRKELAQDPLNAQTLKDIDSSLFTLCLDDYASPLDKDQSHRNLFHSRNARNRWFDKAVQIIVETNGAAGVNGEHSPADAVVPCSVFQHILANESNISTTHTTATSLPAPTLLRWNLGPNAGDALTKADNNAQKLIEDLDSVVFHFEDYGSNFMKKSKISPDGWMQMVYQLAYFRHYGKPCPTYESASTRKFLTGRTETVRSCSVESVAFTTAWEDKDKKMSEKLDLLGKALASQMEYMKAASNGQGVDRHLLGLRCQMTADEAASDDATLFRDPSYSASQYWLLSTSNTSPGDLSWGGFGAVVPEGYGINYAVGKDRVRMSISSWNTYPHTNSAQFRKTLQSVLNEFGEVAEQHLQRA